MLGDAKDRWESTGRRNGRANFHRVFALLSVPSHVADSLMADVVGFKSLALRTFAFGIEGLNGW
jgi:hypothetical protein